MSTRKRLVGYAGAAAGVAAGVAAERLVLARRRRNDPERDEAFGARRGERSRTLSLDDGAKLFIEESGPRSRRGVVFIHGSVLRTDLWHYQMPAFPGRRLVFYDLRGHGRSQPKGDARYLIATLASDLGAVIDDCGLDEVVLVGHSVGGMIAMELCHRHPELLGSPIKGLVLAHTTHRPAVETIFGGAAVVRLERASRRPFDALGSQAQRIERLRKLIKPSDVIFWGVALAAFGPGASARQIDFVYDMLADTPTDVIFDLIKSYRDFDVSDACGDITVPSMVIGGTHDRLTVPEASGYLAERLPKAELELFEGCGHMSMLERHSEFNEVVERFLADTLGATRRRARTERA